MVESGNFQSIDTLQRAVGHKAGAKLTLFIDADHNFATAQVSEFIPFDYEPVMSPMSYEGEVVKDNRNVSDFWDITDFYYLYYYFVIRNYCKVNSLF